MDVRFARSLADMPASDGDRIAWLQQRLQLPKVPIPKDLRDTERRKVVIVRVLRSLLHARDYPEGNIFVSGNFLNSVEILNQIVPLDRVWALEPLISVYVEEKCGESPFFQPGYSQKPATAKQIQSLIDVVAATEVPLVPGIAVALMEDANISYWYRCLCRKYQ